ncbi:hypothetical protein F442_00199 [Phytophthora nicotianae P10297]|uniref:Uncharacterized protein n=5 Tax=Phytophthora nicotianae TaxID=4792 RepID=V9G1C9_PHYNI|nr:hypothetical protein F443_00217 [Phytophthora nicotianae P1569]ETO86229.1 hypothetical protein F444_00208 [Phytophthora nicotianae P1976]ETP55223.1 hypothetical protein F442_00199 [Phytophthora nicotianae P10297]
MVALRRPTESSKAAVATTTKSLSAVSLTKKTNALESYVEELKNNLEVQSREVTQRDEALQELVGKVDMLHDAFNSLSDVVTCEVEEMQKQIATTTSQLQDRVAKLEHSIGLLESQVPRMDGKRRQLQETSERRFLTIQETCSKIELAIYETQSELAHVKNASEDLMTREREAAHLQKTLQLSQEDAVDALKRLKEESSQLQVELFALKEHTTGITTSVASDVQVLATEYSTLRGLVSKQQSQWLGQLKTLQETFDRQGKLDKTQLSQRLDTLSDAVASQEHRTKNAVDNLLKNHTRIRCAVDEGMEICSREVRALSNEVKAIEADQQEKFDQVVQQMATSSIECDQRYDELHLALRSIAHRLKVSL